MDVEDHFRAARQDLDDLAVGDVDLHALRRRAESRERFRRVAVRSTLAVLLVALIAGGAFLGTMDEQSTRVATDDGTGPVPTTAATTDPPPTTGTTQVPMRWDLDGRAVIELEAAFVEGDPADLTDAPADRIHYMDLHRWGPQALTVGPDGTLWVVDGAVRRLVRVSPDGAPLPPIAFPDTVTNANAIGVSTDAIWLLDQNTHSVVRLELDGTLVEMFPLPPETAYIRGFPAITATQLLLDEDGNPIVFVAGQAGQYAVLDARTGTFDLKPTLVIHGTEVELRSGVVTIDGQEHRTMDRRSQNLGGAIVGVTPTGAVVVTVHESFDRGDGTILLQRLVQLHVPDDSPNVLTYRIPDDGLFISVDNDAAVGPDGAIYVLETYERSVRIIQLL